MSRSGQSSGQSSGQRSGQPGAGAAAVAVGSFTLPRGHWFPLHQHPVHQLAWSSTGLLTVRARAGRWLLPPTMALWIPRGVPHATGSTDGAVMRSPYVHPDRCPVGWPHPTVVAVPPLLRDLIDHLTRPGLGPSARGRAEAVLFDLLEPLPVRTVTVTPPTDPRARLVAEALTADPTDDRTLESWGRVAGTSGRTLARLFSAETGTSFGRWREQLRMQAAIPLLAAGLTVESVARRVGYASASSFVAAFRRTLGLTPRQYVS
ncbi:helix-turn-helix transcriptional regulator [Kitasatospora sp. NPDC049258]|uniref:AraC family transcriptional regulator n=1 Tax=Kitasatospora sp. NPDC049258 TaxID=3155394 RepID=UPI00343010B8